MDSEIEYSADGPHYNVREASLRTSASRFEEKNMRCFWRLKCRHAAQGQRVPLPPQHLLVMAAALSLTAVVVSVVIATGDLPCGEGRGGRCG